MAESTTPPGGANGDGSFTYPGPGGAPLGSIRLSNIADGIEVRYIVCVSCSAWARIWARMLAGVVRYAGIVD